MDGLKLFDQKRLTGGNFVGLRVAILRRPTFDDIGDINLFPPELDRLDDLVQQLPGLADERLALKVFVPSRGFADEDQLGLRVSYAEDDLGPVGMQFATTTVSQFRTNGLQTGWRRRTSHPWPGERLCPAR